MKILLNNLKVKPVHKVTMNVPLRINGGKVKMVHMDYIIEGMLNTTKRSQSSSISRNI